MKIYIVHIDAWDGKDFYELTNEEIEQMYEEDSTYIDCFDSVEELAAYWNTDELLYPNMSYMKIVND